MVMKFDLHTHTILSKHWFWRHDAVSSPKEVVKAGIKAGLDGMAVTDHDCVKGSLIAERYVKGKDFLIITGSEIRSEKGDILGLGIRGDVPPLLPVEETIERIHDLGGLAVAAHPTARFPRKCLGKDVVNYKFDAIEVFNSGNVRDANKKALEIALKHKFHMTAGSDAHYHKDVGLAYTICEGDVLEAIRKGKTSFYGRTMGFKRGVRLTCRKFLRSLRTRI